MAKRMVSKSGPKGEVSVKSPPEATNGSESELGNAITCDTNVAINDPYCFFKFLGLEYDEETDVISDSQTWASNSNNHVCIPATVVQELKNQKSRSDIGYEARTALRSIKRLQSDERYRDKLSIIIKPSFKGLEGLDQKDNDFRIIASANAILRDDKYLGKFKEVKLISDDVDIHVFCRAAAKEIKVENYRNTDSELNSRDYEIKQLQIVEDDLIKYDREEAYADYINTFAEHNDGSRSEPLSKEAFMMPYDNLCVECPDDSIAQNEGVVLNIVQPVLDKNGEPVVEQRVALRKDYYLVLVKRRLSAFGVRPTSINGNGTNWPQIIALAQLLDPMLDFVFLQGGAGTGKTIMSVASALAQQNIYNNIMLTNPMVALDDEDKLGFLPGSLGRKIEHWMIPFENAFTEIIRLNKNSEEPQSIPSSNTKKASKNGVKGSNKKNSGKLNLANAENIIKEWKDKGVIEKRSTYDIRGQTWHNSFVIVDDAQNLSAYQIRAIMTRLGRGSKIVFCGDLGQIDRRRYLNRRNSGLAYAIKKMRNQPSVATSVFKDCVRSRGAALAELLM